MNSIRMSSSLLRFSPPRTVRSALDSRSAFAVQTTRKYFCIKASTPDARRQTGRCEREYCSGISLLSLLSLFVLARSSPRWRAIARVAFDQSQWEPLCRRATAYRSRIKQLDLINARSGSGSRPLSPYLPPPLFSMHKKKPFFVFPFFAARRSRPECPELGLALSDQTDAC